MNFDIYLILRGAYVQGAYIQREVCFGDMDLYLKGLIFMILRNIESKEIECFAWTP